MSNILKYQNPSSPLLKPWKALEKMKYEAIPDSTFTRDKTGIGSIEYFSADNNNGITYLNGYHKAHPKPGTDIILYDPATNDQQDVRLDALHFMPKDPIYGALYDEYLLAARDGDVAYNADRLLQEYIDSDKLEQAFKTYDVKNISGLRERLFLNEADGLLRNMFIEGTPEYIKSKRYYPDKTQLEQWNVHLMPYINNIKTYLETGVKPEHVIEPAVIIAYKKGGRIHIKKKNRGSFTRWCKGKVTEECIRRGKNSSNPAIRKKATFAANARKWKHENGGILKAQNSAKIGNPFESSFIQLKSPEWETFKNDAKARVAHKYKDYTDEELSKHMTAVQLGQEREFVNPDGTVRFVTNDQPLRPMGQEVAEWLPGVGDVAEVGYIGRDIKDGNWLNAALAAGLMILPGNVGKVFRKSDIPTSKLTEVERLGIPKGERNNGKILLSMQDLVPSKFTSVPGLKPVGGKMIADKVVNHPHILDRTRRLQQTYKRMIDPDYVSTNNWRKNRGDSPGMKIVDDIDVDITHTNSPTSTTENIGGYYNPPEDIVYVRRRGTPDAQASTAFHEDLHGYDFGRDEINDWIIKHLIDPEKVKGMSPRAQKYYLGSQEAPVHALQHGFIKGLDIGAPYPGDAAFDELLDSGIGGSLYYFKTQTPKDKRRLWRAMTGDLFVKKQGGKLWKQKSPPIN